jgi:putative holliday junction resolvase
MTRTELPLRGRILAVDLGTVRTGLACSDPDQIVASPIETLATPPDDDDLITAIAAVVAEREAAGVVVGYPRTLAGREGSAARRAREVAEALRSRIAGPVVLWDERFTTTEAERVMLAQDASRRERRQAVDRVAASILLQTVLEAQRMRR